MSSDLYPAPEGSHEMPSPIGFYAREALTTKGWALGVRVEVESKGATAGRIRRVEVGVEPSSGDHLLGGPLMPGVPNVHSHAFQRVIAGGTATQRVNSDDHFWTWREAMYQAALTLSPEHIEAIAARCFLELLSAGYTSVAEFHYLHHGLNGERYHDLGELSKRVISAALRVGIPITHLPVLYRWSGVEERPPLSEQRRFILSLDEHERLVQSLRSGYRDDPRVVVGRAPHSLRAVSPRDLNALVDRHQADEEVSPFHIHIAEQRAEVEMWRAAHNARPVEWLLDHAPVDQRWCLIHATHLSAHEVTRLSQSRATVGLCPTTEADLGDGIFPLSDFLKSGGRFGVGSDSNLRADPAEELRLLEWGQRLKHERRNLAFSLGLRDQSLPEERSLGLSLHLAALKGGQDATGRLQGLEVGHWADWVILDESDPGLFGARSHRWSDQWIFAARRAQVRDVYIAGERVISEGQHPLQDEIGRRYQEAVRALREGI